MKGWKILFAAHLVLMVFLMAGMVYAICMQDWTLFFLNLTNIANGATILWLVHRHWRQKK